MEPVFLFIRPRSAPTQAIDSSPVGVEPEGYEGGWHSANNPNPQFGSVCKIRVGVEEWHRQEGLNQVSFHNNRVHFENIPRRKCQVERTL